MTFSNGLFDFEMATFLVSRGECLFVAITRPKTYVVSTVEAKRLMACLWIISKVTNQMTLIGDFYLVAYSKWNQYNVITISSFHCVLELLFRIRPNLKVCK